MSVIHQETAAGLLFAAAGGNSRGSLGARSRDPDGTLHFATVDTREAQRFVRWVRRFGRAALLDLVPRASGRERPYVHVLWVDSAPRNLLDRFRPAPNIVAEHRQGVLGVWQLSQPLRAANALDALAGLAAVLHGDPGAASLEHRAPIPGTLDSSGAAVVAVEIDLKAHAPERLLRAVSALLEAA